MNTLDFTFTASGAYHTTNQDGTRTYSVMRLTSRRWVMDAAFKNGTTFSREEAQTMRQAMILAEVQELAAQCRYDEALALKATIS